MIRYIRVAKEAMDPSQNRKFDGDRDLGSHGGHWDRSGGHVPRKSEVQHHMNGAIFGGRRGGHSGGRDGNNGGGGGAQGGHGNNTTPPLTQTGRKLGAAVRTVGK